MTKTYVLLGRAWSTEPELTVNFSINSNIIYNGVIAATPVPDVEPADLYKILRWNSDNLIEGNNTVSITPTGGIFVLSMFGLVNLVQDISIEYTPDESINEGKFVHYDEKYYQSIKTGKGNLPTDPEFFIEVSADKEIIYELEYPNSMMDQHAVTNTKFNGVLTPSPTNQFKPETPFDIRGWHYKINDNTNFVCDYWFGPYQTQE